MLSQTQRKYIRSLSTTKGRRAEGKFVAEGHRIVEELSRSLRCRTLLVTSRWIDAGGATFGADEVIIVSSKDMEMVSRMDAPQEVLGVFDIPRHDFSADQLSGRLTLALDSVQDPGNLGTIIRIADWFGVTDILCSHGTVDAFNPKVIQSTMGAIGRVAVHYVDLSATLEALPDDVPVYGTFLDGEDIYATTLSPCGVIVMGNEGNGISPEVERHVTSRLLIPSFPPGAANVESLNVGVATAITVAEFRRRALNDIF